MRSRFFALRPYHITATYLPLFSLTLPHALPLPLPRLLFSIQFSYGWSRACASVHSTLTVVLLAIRGCQRIDALLHGSSTGKRKNGSRIAHEFSPVSHRIGGVCDPMMNYLDFRFQRYLAHPPRIPFRKFEKWFEIENATQMNIDLRHPALVALQLFHLASSPFAYFCAPLLLLCSCASIIQFFILSFATRARVHINTRTAAECAALMITLVYSRFWPGLRPLLLD